MTINVRRLRRVAAFAWLVPVAVLVGVYNLLPASQAAAAPQREWLALEAQEPISASVARLETISVTSDSPAVIGTQFVRLGSMQAEAARIGNTSFEVDADRNGRSDTWSEAARAFQAPGVDHSGDHSLLLNSVANRDFRIWQSVHNVRAGEQYDVTGWVNIPATNDQFSFEIAVAWKDAQGQELRVDTVKLWNAQTDGWEHAVATLTVPENTNSATVRLNVSNLAASVYVDDISFLAH